MNPAADGLQRRWAELAPLFDRARQLDAQARERFVDAVADEELRLLLRRLLATGDAPGVLDAGGQALAAAWLDDPRGLEGRMLGPWRVGAPVGAGGMATVFHARRADGAFEQAVAIKVLRIGLHDGYARQRFLRERALLARLEHPGIARVLDGGLTAEGVPWFAMEFVDGQPVTAYCDAGRLPLAARLELFVRLCAAVEHAHNHLVVHRDLKPSNALVAGDGHCKLLDFGIAKLLDAEDADETRPDHRWLTPGYAAPEQIDGGQVTTATDVHGLGVMLHELLAGCRPQRHADGTLRLPSAALAGAAAEAVAEARGTRPAALRRQLAGDLDRIVAKALEVQPERRYPRAAALAADIERHLQGHPVEARPAALAYRAGKFLRRHRRSVAVAAVLAATLAAGVAATAWQARSAARQAARADATRDFVLSLFGGISPDEARGREIPVRELLDRGALRLAEVLPEHPRIHSDLAAQLAAAYRQLGAHDRAAELAAQAVDAAQDEGQRANALLQRGQVQAALGHYPQARADLDAALAAAPPRLQATIRLRLAEVAGEQGDPGALELAAAALAEAERGGDVLAASRARLVLGGIHFRDGHLDQAAAALRAALAQCRERLGELHTLTAQAGHDLGVVRLRQGDAAEAGELFRAALATREVLLGREHPDVADSRFNLGVVLRAQGDAAGAEAAIGEALEVQRRTLGPRHPQVTAALNSLALLAHARGDPEAAIGHLQEAVAGARATHGDSHPSVVAMLNNLAAMQRDLGRGEEALQTAREAARIAGGLGEGHYLVGVSRLNVASLLAEAGALEAALPEFVAAHGVLLAALGAEHPDTLLAALALADARRQDGHVDAAEMLLAGVRAGAAAFPSGHPGHARLALVAARIARERGACAETLPALAAAGRELGATPAPARRADAALLAAEEAACQARLGDGAARTEAAVRARALAAGLRHVAPAFERALADAGA